MLLKVLIIPNYADKRMMHNYFHVLHEVNIDDKDLIYIKDRKGN